MKTIYSGNKGKEAQWLPKHNAVRMVSMVKDIDSRMKILSRSLKYMDNKCV